MKNKHIMNNEQMKKIEEINFAPFLKLAYSLIDKPRRQLSNTFRHQGATYFILIDYGYFDEILLKGSLIHDLIEDIPDFNRNEIVKLPKGNEVLNLILEVSKKKNETKKSFLYRILKQGSKNAKILKCADRISNCIDIGFNSKADFIERDRYNIAYRYSLLRTLNG